MHGLALKSAIALARLLATTGQRAGAIGGLQQALAALGQGRGSRGPQQALTLLAQWQAGA